jgi:ATP diphosphatase
MTGTPSPSRQIGDLVAIMAALRHPETGCQWDLAQTFASIAPYTIEEAHEVAEAISRGDMADLCDELGDLLLQVVFHARMAEETGAFAFADVVEAITAKLIRRHPHVFGDAKDLPPDQVKALWDSIKAAEKQARSARRGEGTAARASRLDSVPAGLPAMQRAVKLQQKAATVGFDWPGPEPVLAKIREELDEVTEALAGGQTAAIHDEVGDLLFAVVNLARHAGVDPDTALGGTNAKFVRRFRQVELALAAENVAIEDASLEAMEAHWQAAKHTER